MEATAKAKYLRMSAKKVRLVIDLIRGQQVDEAIATLRNLQKRAAEPIRKVIRSAAANAISQAGSARLKAEDLTIEKIVVDNGPAYKRFRPVSMGRAHRYKHRTCHVSVKVAGEAQDERRRRKDKTA
ncbi:MAG: 50S ribosomal protein L22 [candidate division Zixibacteria bacterium]|nr:50S ribosomal protein L22 [candidate division Zixibacteria bacterium]